ncbi:MAG: hypothetical protein BEU05_03030 [Marine Group III euryarchaeote CG-Bathy2]|uniref:NRDE family protein n=2 Tax=Methanobacteriati TaxID=3366610 RepID=A0A075GY23_9EURY|nr:hypothetical protein [uncultured marine group II/III euryarchaeote KM3_200_A03]OIR12574.1 MAG: hypothetical protein BEU05_03030 [Marine Group III euryarchaeote CG-Bathy2]
MCLALLAHDCHSRYSLVLAANRDEFHDRPAEPARWRDGGILAGRDRQAGGSWLGVTRNGRWAVLTNLPEPVREDTPSRGGLVLEYLHSDAQPTTALTELLGRDVSGCCLLAGAPGVAAWGSTGGAVAGLEPGIHALSNAPPGTEWPKVVAGRDALRVALRGPEPDPEALFAILADRSVPIAGEPWSAAFVATPEFGTRCSSLLLVGRDGRVEFRERSFDSRGGVTGEVCESYALV